MRKAHEILDTDDDAHAATNRLVAAVCVIVDHEADAAVARLLAQGRPLDEAEHTVDELLPTLYTQAADTFSVSLVSRLTEKLGEFGLDEDGGPVL